VSRGFRFFVDDTRLAEVASFLEDFVFNARDFSSLRLFDSAGGGVAEVRGGTSAAVAVEASVMAVAGGASASAGAAAAVE